MSNSKLFRGLVIAILIFALLYLISLTGFIFDPIWAYVGAVAVPFIGAGFIFYVTNPIVKLLERYKIHRIIGIFIVFLLLILVAYLFINFIAPIVQSQFSRLIDNVPKWSKVVQGWIDDWQQDNTIIPTQVNDTIQGFIGNLDTYIEQAVSFLIAFFGQIFGFVFSFLLIPFFLFFMLKDADKLVPFISKFLSKPKADSFRRLMDSINHTLESFIQGQFIVSLCVGVMLYIGYLIIGLPFSLTLALAGFILNFIPFLGPFLSAIPAIIVGFFQSPMLAVWAIVVMVVAQQIESNLISPNVMGRVLQIHPLTVITLILAAGSIAGFIGLLFIIPIYAIAKAIVSHFYLEWRKKQPDGEKDII
ncbi:AI-2E family transporter [Aquibacillus koreensis]|uniref:AI-2E family transporter n=1 Tax=Aquibacillus koreensis TaxID=279446 RepID=A0A9X3WP03_9BACI|nr:AI-2E family transporter [Aquibacillus koreensis]MCT2538247.1 AI-2E family transporter [Aquibacillus koreensis]MDC3420809.1 AI-2E family transporter [Aquibacillus koreensis]